jgi:hypothetical protein
MRAILNREGAKDAKKKGRVPIEPSDFFRHFSRPSRLRGKPSFIRIGRCRAHDLIPIRII